MNCWRKILGRIYAILSNVCVIFLCLWGVWILFQVTTFASFRVPSESMAPALIPGDRVWVNKWVMGGRVFNVFHTGVWEKRERIYRLPGFGKVSRNDVLVFNHPFPNDWDRIRFHPMVYFVKRCVALPGDTLEIRKGCYHVRGYGGPLGCLEGQRELENVCRDTVSNPIKLVMEAYPNRPELGWTVREFGPLYLPRRGDTLPMTQRNVMLYRKLIEWEQGGTLSLNGDSVRLDGHTIRNYCFQESYYFMAGDKTVNSQDSRYWGLVPESYIVGKAVRIWNSVDPFTDVVRWERVWKEIE